MADNNQLVRLNKLLRMREGEVRVVTMLARSLRLTVPTMVHAITASRKLAKHRGGPPLWEPIR